MAKAFVPGYLLGGLSNIYIHRTNMCISRVPCRMWVV